MSNFNMKGKNRGEANKVGFEGKKVCQAIIGKSLLTCKKRISRCSKKFAMKNFEWIKL